MSESPFFVCETNYDIFQTDLPQAIKIASRFPSNHPSKWNRLSYVEYLILNGADPMKTMWLHGENATPMQRAIEYGDYPTIKTVKEAMEKLKQAPPLIVIEDIDMFKEDRKLQKLPVAILFPGQGSQYKGMLEEVKDLEPCKKLINSANEILGYNILDLCLNGPEEKLDETKYAQPALFLANACALEKLRMDKPEIVERASATAGLSLGEYNALCYAGVISFEDCVRIVRVRADAMHEESKKRPQGMMSVAGLNLSTLEELCVQAAQKAGPNRDGNEALCTVTNHLFPKGYTVSGDTHALAQLKTLAEGEGALQARELKTSGAFHTKYMEPAGLKLLKSLRAKVTDMNFPKCDMYMNVRGAPQRAGTDPRELNYDLAAQVAAPVLWQESIEEMIKNGITEFYECGPMKQLKAMMKRINQDVWKNTTSIPV